jgi:UDP-glucose 4-epimerase
MVRDLPGSHPDRLPARPHNGKVLVVGLGFLGRHVAAELAAAGDPPVILTRSAPSAGHIAGLEHLDLIIGDAADGDVLARALTGARHVVFCAGGLLPAHSEQNPALDARLTLPPLRAVLWALRTRPEVSLTYMSSGGAVYGDPPSMPVSEDEPRLPIGAYGRLRLVCESEIERERRHRGLRVRVLRCATVYGKHQLPDRGQGAVVTFLRHVDRGEPIVVYGDEDNLRDYVYAGDVARIVAALVDRSDGPSVVNVGTGRGTSLTELVELVEAQVGRPADLVRRPKRGFDVRRIVLDSRSLHELVDIEFTPLERGIELTHGWLVKEPPPLVKVA